MTLNKLHLLKNAPFRLTFQNFEFRNFEVLNSDLDILQS